MLKRRWGTPSTVEAFAALVFTLTHISHRGRRRRRRWPRQPVRMLYGLGSEPRAALGSALLRPAMAHHAQEH